MIIAADTRILAGNPAGELLLKSITRLAADQPTHQFIFFSEAGSATVSNNVNCIPVGQAPNSALLWKLWYDYKLPALLKKYKASCFIGPNISSKVNIPQFLFIADTAGKGKNQGKLLQKWLPALVSKASGIFASSDLYKKDMTSRYKIEPEKIMTIYPIADQSYQPLDWQEKEIIKNKWADDKEYFLLVDKLDLHEKLISLLKAFSFFKKRQKSNLELLICTTAAEKNNPFLKSLSSYKHRDDVKLFYGLSTEELAKLTAAAYAFVSIDENMNPLSAINALQCGVPLIVPENDLSHEYFGKAALYANINQLESVAQQLMLVFKDEDKRNELIKSCSESSQKFLPQTAALSMWQSIN